MEHAGCEAAQLRDRPLLIGVGAKLDLRDAPMNRVAEDVGDRDEEQRVVDVERARPLRMHAQESPFGGEGLAMKSAVRCLLSAVLLFLAPAAFA